MSWASWTPSQEQPWDSARVTHLHRRAGFAPNWKTIQSSLDAGFEDTVNDVLNVTGSRKLELEALALTIGDAAVGARSADRLRAWWIYRMMMTPVPLVERMTLLWHNHFATSNAKVQNVAAMYEQNNRLREHCLGKFKDLLPAVVKHRAMLSWLDASANRKEHPNENLARELMELFTLGEGHYTEKDVQAAARCLTGWTIRGDRFKFVPEAHDSGEKTVLGQTGRFDGDALLTLLLRQPATSKRIAWRLCGMFFGEGVVSDAQLNALADGLRRHDLDIGWAVETILRSELFYSDENLRTRIASPAEYIVGAIRSLEMERHPPSTLILSEQFRRQGQDLFHPPNVFGWKEGRSWINTRSVLARQQYASALIAGDMAQSQDPLDVHSLPERYEQHASLDQAEDFYARLISGRSYAVTRTGDRANVNPIEPEQLRKVVASLISHPENQLV